MKGAGLERRGGGRNDHGSSRGAEMLLIGPRLQWYTTLITDASLENALLQWAWSSSSSPECRREYLTRILRAACTLMLPYICLFRDRHAHTNPHCHASTRTHPHMHAIKKETMMIFFFSPRKHSYSHKISTVVVTNKSVPSLQRTPEAESAGWICSVLSNTKTICILSPLLFVQGFFVLFFFLTQKVVYDYAGSKHNKKQNMHFNWAAI